MGIRTEGADDFDRVARALRDAADKDLKRRTTAAMRKEAKPLGQLVIERGADELPRRGGLADRVRAKSRVGVRASYGTTSTRLQVLLSNRGADLRAMDRGILRHPVYGDLLTWVLQRIKAGAFSRAFELEAPRFRDPILKAGQDVLSQVARAAR